MADIEIHNQDSLLPLIKKGDPTALNEFVRGHLSQIYNLCLKLCRSQSDAEDLCQDVFLRATRSIKSFRGDSALSTWIYRIAVNAWKNRVRYESRRSFRSHISLSGHENKDGESDKDLELSDSDPHPDQQLEMKEKRNDILKALDQLEENDRSIIVLRDVEEKSYDEIAVILELNLGTVKSRLARARDRLRTVCLRMGVMSL